MDQPKIERMLRLMKYLSGTVNYSIGELADRLEMSPRTVYRYIDTFRNAGFAVTKLYGDTYKLGKLPKNAPDLENLIYFSEEEAYLVNSLIDRLDRSNSLRANLKAKLAVIYQSTSIADFIDHKTLAGHVEALGEAIEGKREVLLVDYESSHSHSIRDRRVEPFAFSRDYVDVWAFDPEDGRNKVFKLSRMGEVKVLDSPWSHESEHRKDSTDIFRISGTDPVRVRMRLSLLAKNLLVEEYPMAERDLHREGSAWILDTQLYGFAGACRFYVGLAGEIKIIDSPEFETYVRSFVSNNLLPGK